MSKHSKLLVGLVSNEISVTDALFQLKVLLADLRNVEINDWIHGELNGYKTQDTTPSYRNVRCVLYGKLRYFALGKMITETIPVPVKVDKLNYLDIKIRDNITSLEKYSADGSSHRMPFDVRIANEVADLNIDDMTYIIESWLSVPPSAFLEIQNFVKEKVVDTLLQLEAKFGDIDNLSIDFRDDKDSKTFASSILTIIYNDNSISIGSNNALDKSIVGSNNAHKNKKQK